MNTIDEGNTSLSTQTAEIYPVLMEESTNLAKYEKIPLDRLPSLGIGMKSLTAAVQNAAAANSGMATSGLYKVTINGSGHLAAFKDGSGYLGTVLKDTGGIGGQARLTPIVCDPTMIFMAATMFMVQRKMDAIQQTQEEILGYLEQKEKAELRGNIIVLNDIIENYKYNWDNAKFLSNTHMKVLDIKQKSEQSILFAQTRIKNILGKKQLVQISSDVSVRIKKANKAFEDYQLAMYTYAMASYVETMLLKNFNKTYMDHVASKIEEYSFQYRELYTDCYNRLEQLTDRSIDNIVIGGLGKASKAAGEAIAKVPIISKSEIDENLVAVGDIIGTSDQVIRTNRLSKLVTKQSSYVTPFIDNIKAIGKLHEEPLEILFDEKNMYIEKESMRSEYIGD